MMKVDVNGWTVEQKAHHILADVGHSARPDGTESNCKHCGLAIAYIGLGEYRHGFPV